MSDRPVPVPETCRAHYAVLTEQPLDREDHVPLPSEPLLRAHGTSQLAAARVHRLPHQRVLHHEVPVADAADAAVRLRREALALAAEHGGQVLELLPPRVLEAPADAVSLAHAAQWYVLDHAALLDGTLLTDGLDQFGLPAVRVRDVADADRAMVSAVLAGLVHRLIAEWPGHDPVGEATVTLRDIAHGLGDAQADVTPVERGITVRIDYDADDHVLDVAVLQDPATTLFA